MDFIHSFIRKSIESGLVLRLTYSRVLSIISTFQNFGHRILFSFVQLYADMVGATAAQQGLLLSFRNIISFAGQQYFGQASDRVGRIAILTGGFFFSAFTSFLFIDTRSPVLIIVIFAFYSLGFSAIQPVFSAIIGDAYPHQRQAEMLGVIARVGGLFGGLFFLGIGLFNDFYVNPYKLLFESAGISFLFAALVVIILWLKK